MKRLLNFEMIPKTAWYDNVRSRVSHVEWEYIRANVMKGRCQYCGRRDGLFCHEVWEYNNYTQKLVGFETVCFLCNCVHHIGLAEILAQRGELDWNELVRHYCVVNNCTRRDFQEDREEAVRVWLERSQHDWELDLSYLEWAVRLKKPILMSVTNVVDI